MAGPSGFGHHTPGNPAIANAFAFGVEQYR
jgi:hypothetical protein